MNDDLMFEYLVQMGQMRPEEAEIKKKQAMVDALRKTGMNSPEGQMIGKHYVAPGLGQYINQLGQGYMAGQQQGAVDKQMRGMNATQAGVLQDMRDRMRKKPGAGGMLSNGMNTDNYGFDMPGAGY
jgi:outer membrane translocation and assembly module TamA